MRQTRKGSLALLGIFLVSILSFTAHRLSAQATATPLPTTSYDATVPVAWFNLSLQLVRETKGFSPPVASRAFGYLGVALYEAVVPGMPEYQSLAGQSNGWRGAALYTPGQQRHWPTVANAALAEVARNLFANAEDSNLLAIDDLEEQFMLQFAAEVPADLLAQSQAHGMALGRLIYKWSKSDGGHKAYLNNQPLDYVPPIGEGMWVPTPPDNGRALLPLWGSNRPFVLASSDECAPPPPPQFSRDPQSITYQEALEVYETVKNLSYEQRQVALFWADDPGLTATPPGHSIAITTQVLQEKQATLADAAVAYSKVGMALADAFIGSWQVKYTYNRIRPISVIQELIDPSWNLEQISDPVNTPPFPAYTSGHATESGAAMTVLSDLFGDHYQFTDNTHANRNLAPRTFTSFMQAAQEAATSRLYGGIHYRSDNEAGLQQGSCIGEKVNHLKYKK